MEGCIKILRNVSEAFAGKLETGNQYPEIYIEDIDNLRLPRTSDDRANLKRDFQAIAHDLKVAVNEAQNEK